MIPKKLPLPFQYEQVILKLLETLRMIEACFNGTLPLYPRRPRNRESNALIVSGKRFCISRDNL